MIIIQAGANTITAPDGAPASGTVTLMPVLSFEYLEGASRRKVGRKPTVITIVNGAMSPASVDVAPSSGSGHSPTNIFYNATWKLAGFSQWQERWSLPAGTPVVDLLDIALLDTPTLPAYPTAGADGAAGAQGFPGADGAAGAQGLPGTAGAAGAQGLPGTNGAAGAQGLPGQNAVVDGNMFAGHHPEGKLLKSAALTNDLGNARHRGAVFTFTNIAPLNYEIDVMFDGLATPYVVYVPSATWPIVIEFTLPRTLRYQATVGVGFGAWDWRSKSVKIEALSEGAWVTVVDTITNNSEDVHGTIPGNASVGTTALRYTFDNPASTSQFRIVHLWGFDYNSDMWSQLQMPRAGGQMYGGLNVAGNLGVGTTNPAHALDVIGNIRCLAAFGCNGRQPQLAASASVDATDLASALKLVNNLKAILIASGIAF